VAGCEPSHETQEYKQPPTFTGVYFIEKVFNIIAFTSLFIFSTPLAGEEKIREPIDDKAEEAQKIYYSIGGTCLQHPAELLPLYDAFIERFQDETDPRIRKCVANAYYQKGVAFARFGWYKEACAALEAGLEKFHDETDLEVLKEVTMMMLFKSKALFGMLKIQAALATYDTCFARFHEAEAWELRFFAAESRLAKAGVFEKLTLRGRALKELDLCVASFKDDPNPMLRAKTISAIFIKHKILTQLKRTEEAEAMLETCMAHLSSGTPDAIKQEVVNVVLKAGFMLYERGDWEPLSTFYDPYMNFYQNDMTPFFRASIDMMYVLKCLALIHLKRLEEVDALFGGRLKLFSETKNSIGVSYLVGRFVAIGVAQYDIENIEPIIVICDIILRTSRCVVV